MLRDLIAWVLNNYLGKYVENLNTTQLTVALLSGEVELENLPLKKDALSHFGLPIKAYSGSIGKIKLQIPVRQFRTAPWCINIEKVYVVCGPVNLDEWDNNAEELADLHYKQSYLDNLEVKWRTQNEDSSYYASSYSGWMSYGTSLITNIVENLQLNIKDVHIRYEDSITIPKSNFCCGLTIESLTAQSCDTNWIPGFTTNWAQNEATFKLIELNSLSFYMDALDPDDVLSKFESNELVEGIERIKAKSHEYIIKPVSAQAKFKRDRSETPLRTRNRPRLTCNLILNEISLSLNENQYNLLVNGFRGIDDVAKYKKYRLLQPQVNVKENVRAWWIYAAKCHGFLRHRDSMLTAKNNIKYIKICMKLIANPNEILTSDDKEFKETIEKERNLNELIELREICMYILPQPHEIKAAAAAANNQGRSMLVHWFPGWWGWYGNSNVSPVNQSPPLSTGSTPNNEPQTSFEDELLNALADTVETNSILKRDAVFGKFQFTLKKGSLDVYRGGVNEKLKEAIQFHFEELLLNVESRPRSGSHLVSLSLGSILVKDFLTPNTEFPDLIKPQSKDELLLKTKLQRSRISLNLLATSPPIPDENPEPLFQLEYENKPLAYTTDYRLLIKSRSLDIVYNTDVMTWLVEFLSKPHVQGARRKIEAMKNKTKMELKKNFNDIIEGRLSERKTWTFEIDVSAPQILFVENFIDRQGTTIVVIDFGRLQLSNCLQNRVNNAGKATTIQDGNQFDVSIKDSEDDELFLTPCSTPPDFETLTSLESPPTMASDLYQTPLSSNLSHKPSIQLSADETEINETTLYHKIYDRYEISLTDLQVLVCKGRERWNFASSKGTSNLHVLDRFNISLQLERRIVQTTDPQYPSLTLCGTLPKLNAHINESKITSITNMLNSIYNSANDTPIKVDSPILESNVIEEADVNDSYSPDTSKLILLQFSIDQMSLEVQSCGRSIVELQVSGVKAGLTQRANDTNITLSVHGLLLVDAMQSYGPDFELLIASHRHVGMDSLSGSLRQSEPCSPCSPGSPDPSMNIRPTSPLSISRAISSLQRVNSPPPNAWNASFDDIDALITIEVTFIEPEGDGDRLQVANIQFNNLDIIANQETIVELLGFVKRVLPKKTSKSRVSRPVYDESNLTNKPKDERNLRTEITFDFHRLNVLILRAVMRDSFLVARKVGTFTMSEAKIHSTIGKSIKVEGSLGGLQVIDLTPEGINHQRILSVGHDPLTDIPIETIDPVITLSNEIYGIKTQCREDRQALSFKISRNLNACVDIKIRMGSVWVIHCARFMQELSWCATEFKHYLKNLAKSIKEKATDMALGLVQPRSGDLIRSVQEISSSPHHLKRQRTISITRYPDDNFTTSPSVKISLDIVLNTPVLIVPRSSSSPQVLVAHLGKISISNHGGLENCELLNETLTAINEDKLHLSFSAQDFNSEENILFDIEDVEETVKGSVGDDDELSCDIYTIDIRNMNLYSLDTTSRKGFRFSALPRSEEFYSCQEDAVAIIHDTAIRLEICRKTDSTSMHFESSGGSFVSMNDVYEEKLNQLIISGSIVNPLRLSLKRPQYEQLLDTIENAFNVPNDLLRPPQDGSSIKYPMTEKQESEEHDTFSFDDNEKIKKILFSQSSIEKRKDEMLPKVIFSLPVFIIQLNNAENSPVVEICFRDFNVNYEKQNQWETNLQVSLRSVIMEDLLRPIDSKHRIMVTSANDEQQRLQTPFLSNSCPDLTSFGRGANLLSTSLPDNLEQNVGFKQFIKRQSITRKLQNITSNCPGTPPPSPQQTKSTEDNLVIYSSFIVDPQCPQFESKYQSIRAKSSIDFNCLSLNISVESWFVLLNFFGLLSDDDSNSNKASNVTTQTENEQVSLEKSELDITIKSLTLVLVKPEYELARANVSNARFIVTKVGLAKTIEGSLGSISVTDLTVHGCIYREKFMTSGNEALKFTYIKDSSKPAAGKRSLKKDAEVNIKMSSVRYVHTKRFVMDVQTFIKDLFQLQVPVMKKMKSDHQIRPTQLGLEIYAESPLILLPMSARSEKLIIANLGQLTLKNEFKMSNDRETISVRKEKYGPIEMLDVMMVNLLHTDLFAGYRVQKSENTRLQPIIENSNCIDMGNYYLYKSGDSLLKNQCHLKLQIERNIDSWRSHNVDDISVHGFLTKLEAELTLAQYKLIRGFLSYNLGEEIDDVYQSSVLTNIYDSSLSLNSSFAGNEADSTWNNLSIVLDLQDVSVSMKHTPESISLACINFIKSTLKVDSKSDGSQDIDLISQEILITDTRTWLNDSEINPSINVFTNILKPLKDRGTIIQAEIHSRRRDDNTQFTILLNNMRCMMILDWLEQARDFILQIDEQPAELQVLHKKEVPVNNSGTFELKLNVTDSELVFVERTDQFDTNAVILKSTTVLNFKPHEINKSMSINLNNLEVFSCVFNAEDETALSIIDPVTVNMEVRKGTLGIHFQKHFLIRLSYHDVKMFQRMLQSLPQQTHHARNRRSGSGVIISDGRNLLKLKSLGFKHEDCLLALEVSDNQLDEAALWLTQNAEPLRSPAHRKLNEEDGMDINTIEVKASRISICVIDDCKDADVPLIELSLTHLELVQDINFKERTPINGNIREGHLKTVLGSDYYNRGLSGWEPIVEQWKCEANWSYNAAQIASQSSRLNLKIKSNEVLRLNVTSTLMEIYEIVKDNWMQDYYSTNSSVMIKRSPFVPFAIKNDTGARLFFTTYVSTPGNNTIYNPSQQSRTPKEWKIVEAGDTITFSFMQTQTKQRHIDSHKSILHQISVRVEGWAEVGPISVDKVGTFFRHAGPEIVDTYSTAPRSRIVFAVSLEGSARKLITVRSALKFINKLDHPILMKMDHLFGHLNIRSWPPARTVIVASNENYSVPLSHVHAFLYVKPLPLNFSLDDVAVNSNILTNNQIIDRLDGNEYWNRFGKFCDGGTVGNFQFTEKSIHWKDVHDPTEIHQETRTCCSINNKIYKLVFAIKKESYPSKDNSLNALLPGHTITLWPPLRLHNLLPCDLLFRLPTGTQGRISSSNTANIHEVDLDQPLEITITLDSFSGAGQIYIQSVASGTAEVELRLTDVNGKILILKALIQVFRGCGMQISISAPFWLINRTGLPLIFRQEGVSTEFAGQFSENEQARLVSPLMFSFSDPDSSMALTIRLGRRYGTNLPWCQPFNLHKDILHRQLKSNSTNETFIIGIEVRRGRGRYSQTSIVTFSPRFQLYNKSSYKLQFAQKCFATVLTDQIAQSTFIEAVPGCHLPFHWPRLDKEQQLCVRLPEVEECLWSSGIPIQETQSLYINVRDINGIMHFLRLEIILQGATYYMLFGNAEVLPPPIRIDNYSEVPIKFYQNNSRNIIKTSVKPHSSMAYVLDEINGAQSICLEAPDGDTAKCPLYRQNDAQPRLTYQNFIYIAFTHTFENVSNFSANYDDEYDIKAQQLVLGVIGNRVVLVKKQPGDRSQLWRMNNEKQLEHEGSSPPTEPGKASQRFVLDLEKPPQPLQPNQLVVRPANYQRRSTQTWYFTEEGRLMCEHTNLCVQPRNGFFGLRNGTDAVLALIVRDTKIINSYGVPFEQAIERQKMRPGSGYLSINFRMDGPIKTLQIKDVKFKNDLTLAVDPHWRHVSHILPNSYHPEHNEETNVNKSIDEYHINLNLTKGIGFSLVSKRPYEELAYVSFEDIQTEIINTPVIKSLDLSVRDVQIDNQMLETSCPIFMYTIKNSSDTLVEDKLPALQFNMKILSSPNKNAVIFEHLILSLRPLTVYLEERLLLRLADFIGIGKTTQDPAALQDESDYEAQRIVTKVLSANAKRYYFGDLSLVPSQIRLSVITASKLPINLNEIKKGLGLTLIKFEDAVINFDKFCDRHHFETSEVYWAAIKSHYKQELKWQAASILGSVDFLGNPLGFANDLTEGVSSLLKEGNVKSLVKNVTHGISNSTAKLTETLSDGLGRVVLDEQYTETRQRILEVSTTSGGNSTGDHLVAGLKGFGFGLLGGVTSIVKHTYSGAQADGIPGFLSGLGKGIVGTVTKPVIGVLDLASETANAVRETSRSSNRILPDRKRPPRCVTGSAGGLLPAYTSLASKGQQHLLMINKRDYNEKLLAYEPCLLESKESKLRLLVSTENIWVFSKSDDIPMVIFCYNLSELITCRHIEVPSEGGSSSNSKKSNSHYIELCLSLPSKTSLTPSAPEMVKRPRVRCQSEEIAKKAVRHVSTMFYGYEALN
ncbi:hypothetical protein ACKWTF_011000 [Chironomus riparius]